MSKLPGPAERLSLLSYNDEVASNGLDLVAYDPNGCSAPLPDRHPNILLLVSDSKAMVSSRFLWLSPPRPVYLN